MWLIVGLGNPGKQYELTRHNIGFLAIDNLIKKYNLLTKSAFNSEYTKSLPPDNFILLKPQTFMNRSGQAVLAAMTFHKIKPQEIIVIHDDLDLALGEMRIKQGGGHGGHNGLRDISAVLGPDYIRIRLGIGRPSFKGDEANYVLANFTSPELAQVESMQAHIENAIKTLMQDGLEKAQAKCQLKRLSEK